MGPRDIDLLEATLWWSRGDPCLLWFIRGLLSCSIWTVCTSLPLLICLRQVLRKIFFPSDFPQIRMQVNVLLCTMPMLSMRDGEVLSTEGEIVPALNQTIYSEQRLFCRTKSKA